jgi:hypothetical protein
MKNAQYVQIAALSLIILGCLSFISHFFTQSRQLAAVDEAGGPTAYWTLDDGSGSTATDLSGGNNTGTLVGGATWSNDKKIGSGAISLDGVDDEITVTNDIIGTGDVSISAWIKVAGCQTSYCAIVGNGKTILQFDPAYNRINFTNNLYGLVATSPAIFLNQWMHVAVTRTSGGNAIIYINGSQAASGSAGTPAAGSGTLIGNGVFSIGHFNGLIDEVRIYPRVLTASEIGELYAYTSSGSTGGTTPTVVNGVCGSTVNSCIAGTLSDQTDTFTAQLWQCVGSGTNAATASCSIAITTPEDPPPPPPPAGSVTAASCSTAHVQEAVNSVSNGGTVLVPAGSCAWTSGVYISGKNITVKGAGKTSTLISMTGNGQQAFSLTATATRITGFGFTSTGDNGFVAASGEGFRVDHNRLTNSDLRVVYLVSTYGLWVTGVIDHNEFSNAGVLRQGDGAGPPIALASWQIPSSIGNPDQRGVIYVEDNTFTFPTSFPNAVALESNYGGRWVFRFNTVTNGDVGAHSLSGPNQRGTRSWEIYGNTFNLGTFIHAMFLRGGTGVVFNNAVTSNAPNNVNLASLDNERSFQSNFPTPAGPCNGTSSWDVNTTGQKGWPCRDQIGRGTDGAGTFPQPQASEPAYFWNNTINGVQKGPAIVNCSNNNKTGDSCADIVINRDFFSGMARPGYTPYTYPHPIILAQDGGSPIPVTWPSGSVTYKAGDFNQDGIVNTSDYSYLNGSWNTSDPTTDLNKDGRVNTLDYAIMVQNWMK